VSTVLEMNGIWKAYRNLGQAHRTLRSSIVGGDALRRIRAPKRWVLQDVSLRLEEGQALGIVGRNGAGKSTLLRLASRLGVPTRGEIKVDPDTASVLNLGASFALDLTGRENAYTAALVAGHTAGEAKRIVPEALRFAEIEDFADAPMRTYSEGMKLRLAFGVIAADRPRLLVLDEVLAVGDVGFRAKCEARIDEMRQEGTSLVLVSHQADEIASTCDRALWLDQGRVQAVGEAERVVATYEDAARAETLARTPEGLGDTRWGSQELTIDAVELVRADGGATNVVRAGAPLDIVLRVNSRDSAARSPNFNVIVHRMPDELVMFELPVTAAQLGLAQATGTFDLHLKLDRLDLAPGRYGIDVGAYDSEWRHAFDFHWEAQIFEIAAGGEGRGIVRPPAHWSLDRGT
jgi:lipopolysaccharide transport system ATP-binding protein